MGRMKPSCVAAAIAGAVALAGCGSSDPPETPAACLAPASAYVQALRSAPNDVRLAGDTRISDCLIDEQAAGPLETVGKSMVDAANELNHEALRTRDPDGFVQLGYLSGAVERGGEETGGIHRDLVPRVEAAAGYTGAGAQQLPGSLQRAFDYGRDAGLDQG
jgi:hypothetical protein